MKLTRKLITVAAVAALAFTGCSRSSSPNRTAAPPVLNYACYNSAGKIESTLQGLTPQKCAHPGDKIYTSPVTPWSPTPPTTTTTTVPPTVPPTTTTTFELRRCFGVPLTAGQADIDSHGNNTTFCLSGTHNWTLTPKTGDVINGDLINPGILDGQNSTQNAIVPGTATGVVLSNFEVRNYAVNNQQGAIQSDGGSTGWILRDLKVHDNGTVGATGTAGGYGVSLGSGWQVIRGRYYNNRQLGIGGGTGVVLDGVEIDHNNFTNNSYTTTNISCFYEGGGYKWVGNNNTIKNSRVHDNACKGIWPDINATGITITNNQVYNNGEEGIFIELSFSGTITGNNVYNNGFSNPGCSTFLLGGGITLSESDGFEVANNTVTGNCNGITGVQQVRPGNPTLQNLNIHNNTITGAGKTGVIGDSGQVLTGRNIVFTNNSISGGHTFCGFVC